MSGPKQTALRRTRRGLILRACIVGALSGVLTGGFEWGLVQHLQTNGLFDPTTGELTAEATLVAFWTMNVLVLCVVAIAEIITLYYFAIKSAVMVAGCLNLRLVPLNKDRAFVAAALVRTALELGNSSGPIYGVDPHREKSGHSRLAVAMYFVLYRLKIALTGGVLKALTRGLLDGPIASSVAPWMVIPAVTFWNVMIARSVMSDATTTAMGISTSIELFNSCVEVRSRLTASAAVPTNRDS